MMHSICSPKYHRGRERLGRAEGREKGRQEEAKRGPTGIRTRDPLQSHRSTQSKYLTSRPLGRYNGAFVQRHVRITAGPRDDVMGSALSLSATLGRYITRLGLLPVRTIPTTNDHARHVFPQHDRFAHLPAPRPALRLCGTRSGAACRRPCHVRQDCAARAPDGACGADSRRLYPLSGACFAVKGGRAGM